jgi:hypothetical protein
LRPRFAPERASLLGLPLPCGCVARAVPLTNARKTSWSMPQNRR